MSHRPTTEFATRRRPGRPANPEQTLGYQRAVDIRKRRRRGELWKNIATDLGLKRPTVHNLLRDYKPWFARLSGTATSASTLRGELTLTRRSTTRCRDH